MSKYPSKSKIQWFIAILIIALCAAVVYAYHGTDLLDYLKAKKHTTTTEDKADTAKTTTEAPKTAPLSSPGPDTKAEIAPTTQTNANHEAIPQTTDDCYKMHPDSMCLSPDVNKAILDLQKVQPLPVAE